MNVTTDSGYVCELVVVMGNAVDTGDDVKMISDYGDPGLRLRILNFNTAQRAVEDVLNERRL